MGNWMRTDSVGRETLVMVVMAVLFFGLPWFLPMIGGYRELATSILIWGIFVLGFDLLVGFTGYLSFGHAAFWGVGAYVCGYYLIHASQHALLAMLVGVAVVALIAVLLGLITLRRRGIYFAILTLALAEMFFYAVLSPLQHWTGGDNGLSGVPKGTLVGQALDGEMMHVFVAGWALIAFYIARRIQRSPYGLMLRAIKSNETRLLYTGINVFRYKLMAFFISGLYGGLAGTLYALHQSYVPTESLHWTTSGEIVMMSVIGGLGTLIGPLVGAGIVLYLENVLSALTDAWHLILGGLFMAVVIFLPGGVVDGVRRVMRGVTRLHQSGNGR